MVTPPTLTAASVGALQYYVLGKAETKRTDSIAGHVEGKIEFDKGIVHIVNITPLGEFLRPRGGRSSDGRGSDKREAGEPSGGESEESRDEHD